MLNLSRVYPVSSPLLAEECVCVCEDEQWAEGVVLRLCSPRGAEKQVYVVEATPTLELLTATLEKLREAADWLGEAVAADAEEAGRLARLREAAAGIGRLRGMGVVEGRAGLRRQALELAALKEAGLRGDGPAREELGRLREAARSLGAGRWRLREVGCGRIDRFVRLAGRAEAEATGQGAGTGMGYSGEGKKFREPSDWLLGGLRERIQGNLRERARTMVAEGGSREEFFRWATEQVRNEISGQVADCDGRMGAQVNRVLHHADFQRLEGTWRGLWRLVEFSEPDARLRVRTLNVTKKEIAGVFRKFDGVRWDQSPLFRRIYEDEFGTPGGTPYGCLLGDYFFDHSAGDVALLEGLARIGAAAHCPFVAGAAPALMNMESWRELGNPRDVSRIFAGLDYAGWRRLRRSDDSRYLGLVLPRFLGRLPWSVRARPGEAAEFAFEEKCEGRGPEGYVWSNAAFAFGMCLARAFRLHGWCARIRGAESGGLLDNLPCDFFPTDTGDVDLRCPTEISITHRREAELARCGLMPLSHWKGSGAAVFVGAQSLQQPETYEDADATVNASLSSRLPYLFAVCRFAHYLKVMVRDKTGRDMSREEVERYLHNWIMGYVSDDATASEERKCEAPLRKAHVEVQDDLENPGRYRAVFWLRPHFQLEGLTVSLRLLSRLPPQG